jgi:hypothetical protein
MIASDLMEQLHHVDEAQKKLNDELFVLDNLLQATIEEDFGEAVD